MINLPALREAVAKMTPGAWDVQADASDEACVFTYAPGRGLVFICTMDEDATSHEERDANAAGIVALRNAAPALLDEVERLQSLWDAEHATVMRLLSERDAAREQRDTFAVEMKDEACAAVDKVTASACDKIDALNQRHAEIVSVVADISKAYAADKKRHAEAVERAFRTGYRVCVEDREAPDIVHGSEDAAWIVSEAKARLL